jgi:hypothetical protein
MHISDLPLPLRLRNALLKAGFNTDADIRDWFNGAGHADVEDGVIPGVGATGMRQLQDWLGEAEKTLEVTVAPLEVARPTFGELADGLGTLEEAVAKSTKRHEVAQMVDSAMRGGLEKLNSLSHAEIQHRTDVVTSRGGVIETYSGRNTLILRLEEELNTRIAQLIPTIKALPHVKELGVEVSRETVGRMALIRGLDSLERAHKGAAKAEITQNQSETAASEADPVVSDDGDAYSTPEGWAKVGPTEAIPVPEAVLHDYYTQNGWNRYWGRVDDQVIYFYWSPEKRLQGLKPFPGTDKSGRRMAEQATPWGPGHVVPTKWANS